MKLGICILAAGRSRRMNSGTSKIFTPLAGQTLLEHVWHKAEALMPEETVIIVSKEDKNATKNLFPQASIFVQEKALGTGHAVQMLLPIWESVDQWLVICGDMPLLEVDCLKNLTHETGQADICLLAMNPEDSNHKYGRLVIDSQLKRVAAIFEAKDARWSSASSLCYAGAMAIKASKRCKQVLEGLSFHEAGEIYLTDCIADLNHNGGACSYIMTQDDQSCLGINTQHDYARACQIFQKHLRHYWMERGVRFINPETVTLSFDTRLDQDVVVHPYVVIEKNVAIGKGTVVLPFSYLEDAEIHENCRIGPFAHIRGNSCINKGSTVGSFVEVKHTRMGEKVSAKHLAYLGDTCIGHGVNVGAGVVTCNYDGRSKNKTVIQDKAFVGSVSALIAPVTIGENAMIAAGSVIRSDVESDHLAYCTNIQKSRKKK